MLTNFVKAVRAGDGPQFVSEYYVPGYRGANDHVRRPLWALPNCMARKGAIRK